MVAFILGAGLGTRLRPLTEVRPKPLIPVCNRPLIEYAFDHLLGSDGSDQSDGSNALGIERFVVNTHWLPEVYPRLFPDAVYRGKPIAFRHEPQILETAGGIKNVEDLLGGEPFIVYNGDILTDLPLAPGLQAHRELGNEVTLVLRSSGGPLQISLGADGGAIVDISGRLGSPAAPRYLFTGVYFVQPEFLRRIPAGEKISVIPIFLQMIREGAKLGGVVIDQGHWWDLGSREQYLAVHQHYATQAPWIDPAARIAASAVVTGASAIGAGVVVGEGARIHDSLLWPGTKIAAGAELRRCIVTGRQGVGGELVDADC
jgi:mannose-1-phosphate guanylyltransferase